MKRGIRIKQFVFPSFQRYYNFIHFKRIVKKNNYFNEEYYKKTYSLVESDNIDLLLHYYEHGWKEGKNPCPEFDTQQYLLNNPDVRNAGINPLFHYLQHGRKEGREIYKTKEVFSQSDIDNIKRILNGGIFDEDYYLQTYPEVKNCGVDAATHFYFRGYKEGKAPCPNFNWQFYSK